MTPGSTAIAVLLLTFGVTADQAGSPSSAVNVQSAALTRMRDAVNRGDARGYAAVYSSDATITIFGANQLRGRDAIEQHERELLSQFPGTRFEFFDTWHRDDIVVARYGVNGRSAEGRAMGHEGLLFFRFNSAGEIVSEERYLDSFTPMTQLGARPGFPARGLPVLPDRARVHAGSDANAEAGRVTAVRRFFAAVDARLPSLRDEVTAATTIEEMMLPEPFTGTEAGRRWLDAMAGFADTRFDVGAILGVGQYVLVAGIWHGRVTGNVGPIAQADRPFQVHRAAIVELNARGQIVSMRAFMNGRELAQSLGQ